MRDELRKKIVEFNKKARQANADGFIVMRGCVYTDGGPTGFSKKICDVMDYEGGAR